MLEIGSMIGGRYKIINKIGGGDMSLVYCAEDEMEHKQWAVKVFPKEGIRDQEVMTQSLVANPEVLKTFEHPNLVRFIEVIEDEDKYLIVMEYIQGKSLLQVLERKQTIEQEQVVLWAKQICDALEYLHTRKPAVIHKNVKPVNVMLKPDGSIMLIDFASVREFKDKRVESARWLATAGYAAPEQFGHEGEITPATDVYGLGATMYQLLTGDNPCKPPYKIERPIRSFNENLSAGLEKIIQKCLAENPMERYQSVAELRQDLEHYNEIDEIYRKRKMHRRKMVAACITAGVLVLGAIVFGFYSASNKRGEEYNSMLMSAENVQDYYETILLAPHKSRAYFRLNDFLIEDDLLKREEGQQLTQLQVGIRENGKRGSGKMVNVLEELRKANYLEYQEVCYRIGESFAFFYELDNRKYDDARWWFEEASGRYVIANVFCEVADCLHEISKYEKEEVSEEKGRAYELLWEKLKSLNICAEGLGYEDVYKKVQVWNEIVSIIRDNVEELFTEKNSEEMTELLNRIMESSSYINSEELRDDVEHLQDSIRDVKGEIYSIEKALQN